MLLDLLGINKVIKQIRCRLQKLENNSNSNEGDFIPLSGTTDGNPVTGDIDFGVLDAEYKSISYKDGFDYKGGFSLGAVPDISGISTGLGFYKFLENGYANFMISNTGTLQYIFDDLTTQTSFVIGLYGFSFNSTNPTSKGFYSDTDFSETDPTNKLIYAQRSYVERPETLITALNNCDSTQLDEIKTILGII